VDMVLAESESGCWDAQRSEVRKIYRSATRSRLAKVQHESLRTLTGGTDASPFLTLRSLGRNDVCGGLRVGRNDCPRADKRDESEEHHRMLQYIPASFKAVSHVSPKLCYTRRDAIVSAAAPSRPVDRGLGGPGSLFTSLAKGEDRHLRSSRVGEKSACLTRRNHQHGDQIRKGRTLGSACRSRSLSPLPQ
jgi:hypothetical protein